ncbi:2-dehydro-3-deoxygalactonokinase [Roseovarius autotrophicus]|uniref:2-dehydro-3-deoxygalactonokinase n=1 Tax=Roseovarius autotrophicus TaxID=2824121 RepID=UPI001B363382|nr:2-dehydro-3-deoxygalactonokinase [Roseovarius autotrophicus]
MSRWRLCGHDGRGGRAFALDGVRVLAEAGGVSADEAIASLDRATGPVLRVGEGVAARLPARLLPESGPTLPGLEQVSPPDVLDGWTRLLLIGLTEAAPNWDGVACVLTPTLAHWVHLSAREAVSCLSFLTPRLVMALGGAKEVDPAALADSISRPERLAAHLRVAEVTGRPAVLTGHLLGAELAAARPYWLGQSLALVAPDGTASGRAAALAAQGVPVTCHDPDMLLPSAFAALAGRGA